MAENPNDLIVQILVGSPEQIRAGNGETAVTVTQAAFRLGISGSRFHVLVKEGQIRACAFLGATGLYLESEVEALRSARREGRG